MGAVTFDQQHHPVMVVCFSCVVMLYDSLRMGVFLWWSCCMTLYPYTPTTPPVPPPLYLYMHETAHWW